MKVYADQPLRCLVQVLSDLFALALLGAAVWLATEVHAEVMRLRAPGDGLVDAGSYLTGTFNSAADNATEVPLVGDTLADALHTGSDAGTKLTEAGNWQIEAVGDLAWWMAVLLVAVVATLLLVTWLPRRVRFARDATASARLRALGEDGLDLLALRALATHPLPRLAAAGEVTEGWRNQDPAVIARLARLELKRHGLRAPKPVAR
jgi:hypothetical protein